MKGMVFAAGLGTRLKPLTDSMPKALIEVNGKTLLEWAIEKLKHAGCREIVVNVHHFPDQIRQFFKLNDNFGVVIHISDESDELLDTGGGLLKAAAFLAGNDPVVVWNVDVVSSINLSAMISYHQQNNALATLAVRRRHTTRYLVFDKSMRLTGWTNTATGQVKGPMTVTPDEEHCYAFSGIQVISPKLFDQAPFTGKQSIIDLYMNLAANNLIKGYPDQSPIWVDLGKPEQLQSATALLKDYSI